jgi:molybdenum cofactor synthesis domain-containing protein
LAIVTISDGVARGERTDTSGRAIAEWAAAREHSLTAQVLLADDAAAIASALVKIADAQETDVILTTGGTGLTNRDVTPEATRAVLERAAPGIAEAIRFEGSPHTSYAWLSRGLAGTRGRTLIVNLPGSEAGVRDGLTVLDRILTHAVQLLRGVDTSKH